MIQIDAPISLATAQTQCLALFVSDLHLTPQLPRTTESFLRFLEWVPRCTKQLYLLGDIFEFWVGDDQLQDAYYSQLALAIKNVSQRGVLVSWIAGNRDFLVSSKFFEFCGVNPLSDPSKLEFGASTLILAHGDALCTDDAAYMAFRQQVRTSDWQSKFLSMPYAERFSIALSMREKSRAAHKSTTYEISDINPDALDQIFTFSDPIQSEILVHGHTHRPAIHHHGVNKNKTRIVLTDWDLDHDNPRAGGWALTSNYHLCPFDWR